MANYKDKFCFVIGGAYEEIYWYYLNETGSEYSDDSRFFSLSDVELYNIGTN